MQILIRNIDRNLTQPEIVCLFRKYGRVNSCVIVKLILNKINVLEILFSYVISELSFMGKWVGF